MRIIVVALAAGIGFGLVTGGRPANINRRSLELVWLLVASVALQAAAEAIDVGDEIGLAMILVSYVGLAAFAVANIRLVGMPVVLVGLLCNLVVITVNAGMPVDAEAVVASRAVPAASVTSVDFGAKRHLATAADDLTVLGDRIPVRPSREVVSFGDLILAVGLADVLFRLLKPVELRRRTEEHAVRRSAPVRTRELVGV